MSFFIYKSVAERYAKHRPYFHPLVIEKIRAYLQLGGPVHFAVDVGCGSGHSTVALKEIADLVAGLDISKDMLDVAERKSDIYYVQATAERLAINSNSADLITTSMAYHWFNQQQFFAETKRILKAGAWLVIFNHGFRGQMKENLEFEQWFLNVYEEHYPSPPRNAEPMTSETAKRYGFTFPSQEEIQNDVVFTVEELAAYLITQSNVIARTEHGEETVEEVYDWLIKQTRPFFKSERATFPFSGLIWYLQKDS